MNKQIATIVENRKIIDSVYLMKVETSGLSIRPGEFANISIDGHFLRRPISINDVVGNTISFLYKVVGQGTKEMSEYPIGKKLDILFNLGNGFDLSRAEKPLLIGGGIGIAPLFYLAKSFLDLGIKPIAVLGFKNKNEVFFIDEFSKLCQTYILTDDGSIGSKGNPVSFLKENRLDYDHYYACGPSIMLHYLTESFKNGEASLEARMGCGFGACMGCSIETSNGIKRICKEGPVFLATEVRL